MTACTCQYGEITPRWYITVKTCPLHAHLYDATQAPDWWNVAANTYRPQTRRRSGLRERIGWYVGRA